MAFTFLKVYERTFYTRRGGDKHGDYFLLHEPHSVLQDSKCGVVADLLVEKCEHLLLLSKVPITGERVVRCHDLSKRRKTSFKLLIKLKDTGTDVKHSLWGLFMTSRRKSNHIVFFRISNNSIFYYQTK